MPQPQENRRLAEIFNAGLAQVDPFTIIKERFILDNDKIIIRNGYSNIQFDLSLFNKIMVIGAGKATARMALAIEDILGKRITRGVISVKQGHTEGLNIIRQMISGHPVPDQGSIEAAREIEMLASGADEKTLVINLISGGGSALLSSPLWFKDSSDTISLTLSDKQETTRLLLASGAAIQEINCIRKHLSGIKGGRLAAHMYPATSLNLILSDVVDDRLDSIASGPTAPDGTTFTDALSIIEKYGLTDKLPSNAIGLLTEGALGRIPETPKHGDKIFGRVHNILIGTNRDALLAAEVMAKSLGYNTKILTSSLTGESSEAAKFFFSIARDIALHSFAAKKPACVLAGGETTVTVKGTGSGGRNQEMALAFLEEIESNEERSGGIYFLSSATDGNDGPTDAAGAFASLDVLRRSREAGLSIKKHLADNDSYSFFEKIGGLYKTGPTNTNVCDIQIILIV